MVEAYFEKSKIIDPSVVKELCEAIPPQDQEDWYSYTSWAFASTASNETLKTILELENNLERRDLLYCVFYCRTDQIDLDLVKYLYERQSEKDYSMR